MPLGSEGVDRPLQLADALHCNDEEAEKTIKEVNQSRQAYLDALRDASEFSFPTASTPQFRFRTCIHRSILETFRRNSCFFPRHIIQNNGEIYEPIMNTDIGPGSM